MVKVEIIEEEVNKSEGRKYPWLGQTTSSYKRVVLFSREGVGMVVSPRLGVDEFLYDSSTWDMSCFEEFKGKIILSNED